MVDGTPTPTKTGVPGFAINFNTRVDPQNYCPATMKRERRGMWVGLNEWTFVYFRNSAGSATVRGGRGRESNTVSSSHPSKVTALHMVTLGISSWQRNSKKSLLILYLNEQDKEYFVLMFSSTMENNLREGSLWNPGTSVILTTYSSGTSISWLLIWSMMSWGGFPSTVHPTDCKQK